ncbi:MAG: sugar ABC transporter permease, partial [Microvirga sp.]
MPISAQQSRTFRHRSWVAFLVLPPIVFVCLFVVYPILSAFGYAFYTWQGLARGPFVGLANFREVLFGPTMAPVVWNAFVHNVQALVSLVIVQNGVGFLLAWLLYKEPFGFRFHRIAVFVPVVLSTIIVGFLWKLFLNPNFGIVNQALYGLGLDVLARPWLGDSWTALPALVLANAWHFIGFPTLVYLAGMQRIPSEIIEAARLDGTSEWQLLRTIVWPLVAPSTTILFTLLFIGAFNWFEIPYVMVGLDGSPFGSTDVLGLVFYRTAFGNQSASIQNFGQGSALAT